MLDYNGALIIVKENIEIIENDINCIDFCRKMLEFVLAVLGFANFELKIPFRKATVEGDFHVLRREPDGTWVHKLGWHQEPRAVTEEDKKILNERFDVSKVALFAFESPSK